MTSGLLIFGVFPELERLGQPTLQRLCDSWRSTPIAREFAVSSLEVGDDKSLSFEYQLNHDIVEGEAIYFPIDRLLFFIADNGVADAAEREVVKGRITAAREANGPDRFSRFKIQLGPKRPLFLTCPHCGCVMQTQHTAYACEQVRIDDGEADCPECHRTFTFDGSKLHFEPE